MSKKSSDGTKIPKFIGKGKKKNTEKTTESDKTKKEKKKVNFATPIMLRRNSKYGATKNI